MTKRSLVDRLADLSTLSTVPRAELEWLATHGEVFAYERGAVIYSNDNPPPGCYIVLSGRITIRVVRDGVARIVSAMPAGTVGGRLPYSRMPRSAADAPSAIPQFTSLAEDPAEILLILDQDVREIARHCYEFTALCVHQMVDRTRQFKSDDLQREKMASLGRLAAGLAHELNNPSSAVARSAREMDVCRLEVVAATRALCAAGLSDDQLAAVSALEAAAARHDASRDTPLARADREDALAEWLEARGLSPALADPLSCAGIGAEHLNGFGEAASGPQLEAGLRFVAADAAAGQLTAEIEHAATRIHTLVEAVKKHTHMDRAPAPELIRLDQCLADTFAIVDAKATQRAVTLSLQLEPDLPAIRGIVAELNEVWLHLVDNAIDASPERDQVIVAAVQRDDRVIITVTDHGPGIPEADRARIFDPFFTTKAVGQGTGLGLDVVQGHVRRHGGSIEVQSRPGCTEFRVALPAERGTPA